MICDLTPSECRVLICLADGSHLKEIGYDLGVSVNTAGTWAKRAYRKLKVRGKIEAVRAHRRMRDHTCQRVAVS